MTRAQVHHHDRSNAITVTSRCEWPLHIENNLMPAVNAIRLDLIEAKWQLHDALTGSSTR
jgi:hypothetical protein